MTWIRNFICKLKDNTISILFWMAIFVLLTISNASFDLILSVIISSVLTLGMMVVVVVSKKLLIPRLYKWFAVFLLVSIVFIALFARVSSVVLDEVTFSYIDRTGMKHQDEKSLLDIELPSETKSFFEEHNRMEQERLSLSSAWKAFILYVGAFVFSLMTFYRKRAEEIETQRTHLLQEKMQMELNFLRSQINPHFLFNALNNIYSMIYTGDKHAADCVLSLSEMLRYVTYESKENRILLSGEVVYLENYIEFQRYSYEEDINVTFEKNLKSEQIYIAPMLLQPFVENAFKYSGISQQEKDAFIHIKLDADNDKIVFYIENSIRKTKKEDKTKRGIGIENVKKRLDLLYLNNYSLNIDEDSAIYKLTLYIDLTADIVC